MEPEGGTALCAGYLTARVMSDMVTGMKCFVEGFIDGALLALRVFGPGVALAVGVFLVVEGIQ